LLALISVAVALDLLLDRFEVPDDGESIIKRTEATRFGLKPNVRPISSGEGTRFLTTNVAMLKVCACGTKVSSTTHLPPL
jgi:hypothetical protein